jgi:O-antigen/teichoic acid export membrane protein
MNIKSALGSQWVATIYVAIISLLLSIILARVLGPVQFGVYSYVLSIACIFSIIQDGGFKTLLFREITLNSKHLIEKADELLPMALGHVIVATIIGCLFVEIFPWNYKNALISGVICFGSISISGIVSAYLKGTGNFEKYSAWHSIQRTLSAISIITAIMLGWHKIELIFISWASGICIALSIPLAREVLKKPKFSLRKNAYREISAFFIIDFATMIYFRSDMVLLKYLNRGDAEIGQYAAAYRILEGIIMMVTPIAHLCFRSLRLVRLEHEQFRRLFLQILGVMVFIAFALYFLIYKFGQPVVIAIYGISFNEAANLTLLLMVAIVFIFPNYIITQAIIAINKEKIYAIIATFSALFNILLNYLLIPKYGVRGAAISTILTEAVLFTLLAFLSWIWFVFLKFSKTGEITE